MADSLLKTLAQEWFRNHVGTERHGDEGHVDQQPFIRVQPHRQPVRLNPCVLKVNRPLKNGGQTNKTVSRSSEAAPLAVRLMEGVLLKLVVSMRLS